MQYSDSIVNILNDFSVYIDEIEAESLRHIICSKGFLSQRAVFAITGDPYVSYIISKYMKRKLLFSSFTGIMNDSIQSYAYSADAMLNLKNHSLGIIIEKDRGEYNAMDNIKLFYSLTPHVTVGNMRVKTGRGLLCEYADYYSALSTPFYSMRFEGDVTKSEYPSFRGVGIAGSFMGVRLYSVLSYNTYDAALDSNNNVHKVLQYNIHDDSLSVSRRDNLPEYSALIMGSQKNGIVSCGILYSRFGRYINNIESEHLLAGSIFGKWNIFSYDMAISSNGGYAISYAVKKTYSREITLKASYKHVNKYFNVHSKYTDINRADIVTASIRFHKPVGILYEGIFDIMDNELLHTLTYYPVSGFSIRCKYDQTENDMTLRFRVKSLEKGSLIVFNTMKLNSSMSIIIRSDVKCMFSNISINSFAYYYHIAHDDMMSEYEYTVPGVYAMKNVYSGNGLRSGLGLSFNMHEGAMLHIGGLYDADHSFKLCFNIELTI